MKTQGNCFRPKCCLSDLKKRNRIPYFFMFFFQCCWAEKPKDQSKDWCHLVQPWAKWSTRVYACVCVVGWGVGFSWQQRQTRVSEHLSTASPSVWSSSSRRKDEARWAACVHDTFVINLELRCVHQFLDLMKQILNDYMKEILGSVSFVAAAHSNSPPGIHYLCSYAKNRARPVLWLDKNFYIKWKCEILTS